MGTSSTKSNLSTFSWLRNAALVLVLALVATRCLTPEFLRDPSPVVPGKHAAPRGVGAAIGVMLDLASCLPALLVLLDQALRSTRRRTGVAPRLFIAFAAFAGVSCWWASDRYAAAVGASHILAAAMLIWAAAQLIGDWKSAASVAAVCLGLLLCLLAQGIYYRTVDLPDLRNSWINDVGGTRSELLKQHNWEADSFAAHQFALKILHGDFATFYTSANTYAAMLVLLAVVTSGLFLSHPRSRKNLALLVLLIPLFWMLWLTQCKAAFVTLALAAILFILLRLFFPVLIPWRKTVYVFVIAIFSAATGLMIQYGLRHGNLHNDSLNFRWKYWVAAAAMFRAHPWLGVGWNNFGEHYLAFRLPSASEEIKDPHDMFVRIFTELGVTGGVVFVAFLLAAWWRMTVPRQPAPDESGSISARDLMTAVVLAMAINTATTIDFSQIVAYVFIELMRRFLYMALMLVAVLFVMDGKRTQLRGVVLSWLPAAIAIGLAVFLVHNLIDFAMFDPSPGPLLLFSLLTGSLIGMRSNGHASARFAWPVFAVALVVFLGIAFGFVAPVVLADAAEMQGNALFRSGKMDQALPFYAQALQLIPYNVAYPLQQAEAMMYAGIPPSQVSAVLDTSIADDSRFIEAYLLRARYFQSQPLSDYTAIAHDYDRALALNPNEVSIRLEFANFLKNSGNTAEAARQYRQALAYNNQLAPDEPKRLSPLQIEQIEHTIRSLDAHS